MSDIDQDIQELRARLKEGSIRNAYKGIVSYMARLRSALAEQHGPRQVSGIYQGYLDITHFAFFPEPLKERDLKLTVLFNYETFNFEVWLTARNRDVGKCYWGLLRQAGYNQHPLLEPAVGNVAIVKAILSDDFSLADEARLTEQLTQGLLVFEREIVASLNAVDAS
ncbi:hypothetical protein QEH52_09510 [Coraliomargarita sp. SDUM461003]|uniref:DUF7000 domain-containing protein n=1 Tax=Thalassobacterium maritimum TaxID=3041265 RepID=A0ABU1AUA8_9BACT|nr:hypothetical protein [Coraliomargarita sp. SDUM461003]MDQ8207746.1 hypothetical protein [Coraliomargarita sp. SDUM461003]